MAAIAIGLAGSLTAVLVATALRRHRRRPWAELGLAAVLVTNLGTTLPPLMGDGDGPEPLMLSAAMAAWLVVLFTFPDGRPAPRIAMWVLGASLTLILAALVPGVPQIVAPVAFVPAFAIGVGTQVWRYQRRSTARERQATKWLIAGLIPAGALFIGTGLIVSTTVLDHGLFDEPWYLASSLASIWLVPVSGTVGLLMGERGRIDGWVRATVLVCGVGWSVAWAYFLVLPHVGATLAALVAVLLVIPVRTQVDRFATRVVHGTDGSSTVSMLGHRLESSVTPQDVTEVVARTIADGLAVPYAAVTLDGGLAAFAGTPPPEGELHAASERFPVVYLGSTVGEIVVAPRIGDIGLDERDRATVARLAATAGPALHGALTLQELSIARERLVFAREEERRRLRRDLHDDLAPTLAGLGLRAAAAESFSAIDAERAARVHADLQRGINAAIAQVREIAYDLRPPILDDHGLEAAIRARLATEEDPALAVSIQVDALPSPMPAAVELAALRIVQEAVTNVRRHAMATICHIEIAGRSGVLHVKVTDDGRGIPEGGPHGIGSRSIGERAEELGGSWSIRVGDSGGTVVEVLLPIMAHERW